MAETVDRTESLFAAAVALPPADRDAYLDRECSEDPALRERIVALLKAHDRAGHVIDRPADGEPDQTAGYAPTTEQPGTIVAGRYKLLEEIGQGGMGTVWPAEQTIPVRRRVALKLIKAGMDSRAVLARFEAERQALALMDHPNIAKVLDGGLTESGRPYFVMEYVKGVPITEYCDATRMSVEERLNLFIQVCSALQHAHQKGIIHRDLKPSNILVAPYDDKPVPKVIDFGLAKAMHQSLTEKTLYTAHEMVLGTPLYMSPEQAQLNNLDVDTRADIYSLGVLLYELLTGTTPIERQRFKEAAWDEIRRMIREEEPPRPSMRLSSTDTLPSLATFRQTEPAKLKKLVRGDLDWIVMKALEKDRTRRCETANGIARDIQRYLDDEVVEARPPSTRYRFRKFVRRHKAQVIAVSLVLLALLAGTAGTTWGLIREARANFRLAKSLDRERKANIDLATASAKVQARYDLAVDAVKTFHTGVSEDFLLKEDNFKDLRNRLLKSASDFYGKLGALLGMESDFGSRRALAQSNFELAILTTMIGRHKEALAAHLSVLKDRELLADRPGADTAAKADVAESLRAVASILFFTGKADEALAKYRRSESLLEGLAASHPRARAELARCRTNMARQLFLSGKIEQARTALRLARADQEVLANAPGASVEDRSALAATVDALGAMLWYTGRAAEAESEFRVALSIQQRLADEDPASTRFDGTLASIHGGLGMVLSFTGKPAEAAEEIRAAVALYQKFADQNPAVKMLRRHLAVGRINLGQVLKLLGEPAEAEVQFRAAILIAQNLVDENPEVNEYNNVLALGLMNLGDLLLQLGKLAEAEAETRRALAIHQKVVDSSPSVAYYGGYLVYALINLGDVLRAVGRTAEARVSYDRAIALEEPQAQKDATDKERRYRLACSRRRRGLALRDLGEPAGAAEDFRLALRLCDGLPLQSGQDAFETACCHASLAGLTKQTGSGVSVADGELEAARAIEWLRRAVAVGYRNTNQIRNESALDSLRNRPDFKKLMAGLEKNSPAQQEKK